MIGRILNKALLDRVANLLNLEGVRRFPSILDLDDIKAVIDIGRIDGLATPGAGQGQWESYSLTYNVGGLSEQSAAPILQGAETGLNAFRVEVISMLFTFIDAAALATFTANNLSIAMEVGFLYSEGDPGFVPIYVGQFTPVAEQLTYRVYLCGANTIPSGSNVGATWNGAVPAHVDAFGQGFVTLVANLFIPDDPSGGSAVFPANSTWNIFATAREGTNGIVPVP